MRTVEMKYRRVLVRHTRRIDIPNAYEEMTSRQFLASIRLAKGWSDEYTFFCDFFGIDGKIFGKLDSFQKYKLAEMVDFLREPQTPIKHFIIEALPGNFFAPCEKLRGMTLQQFMTADTFSSWYVCTDKSRYLDLLAASLYLHRDEKFSDVEIDEREKKMTAVPEDVKFAILVNWSLIKMWLGNVFHELFSSSGGKSDKPKPANWLALFDSFVGDNIASIDAYKDLPCMDAFRIINRRIKEQKK